MYKAFLLSTLMLVAALAGCTDDPPSGAFTATTPAAFADSASATLTVEPASNAYPVNDPTGGEQECDLDALTEAINAVTSVAGLELLPTCDDPVSSVTGHFASLKTPAMSYSVHLVGASGEFKLGDLTEASAGPTHYDLAGEFPGQDLSGYDAMELRDGTTTIARAGGNGGNFELAEELEMVSAAVTYEGKDITVVLTDAPEGVSLVAWLVSTDEAGELVHEESFVLSGAESTYTAGMNVADFTEFHVHVGTSKVNVAVATI